MPTLYDSLQLGPLTLPNRVVMSPLTRLRGTTDNMPTPIMQQYYAQRAGAGLIISEGVPVSPQGVGYPQVPGIWLKQQVEGWKPVTDAVHAAGGRIFMQLWHVGRISHSSYLHGLLPVAPSAIRPSGTVSLVRPQVEFETPRALEVSEIQGVVESFHRGAINAKEAGFDGVEVHGANGYLLDQFLQDSTNKRTDQYGGPIENRARLMLEVADAVSAVFGPDRVGMHLAPRCDAHNMGDSNPEATFGYVARELGRRGLAFLCAREHIQDGEWLGPKLKQIFGGVYFANERFDRELAERTVSLGEADAVAFGKLFIANPDLAERLRLKAPLNEPQPASFYSHGSDGYVDYPALEPA